MQKQSSPRGWRIFFEGITPHTLASKSRWRERNFALYRGGIWRIFPGAGTEGEDPILNLLLSPTPRLHNLRKEKKVKGKEREKWEVRVCRNCTYSSGTY